MYTILKPECRAKKSHLEAELSGSGFRVVSRHPIKDWERMAERLYAQQADADYKFEDELRVYLKLTQHLFGNSAAALLLERNGNLQDNLTALQEVKKRFREARSVEDRAYGLFANLDEVCHGIRSDLGISGGIRVGEREFDQPFNGRWNYFFFKYIHTPDPDVDTYNREMGLLTREGVFREVIPEREWEIMRRAETLARIGEI